MCSFGNHLRLLLIATASFATALSLQAQYITGHRVRYDSVRSTGVTPNETFVVDSTPGAVEVRQSSSGTLSFDLFDITVTQAAILIHGIKTVHFADSPNKIRFTFLDLPSPAFKNVALVPIYDWPNLTDSALAVGPNYIELDFGGRNDRTNYWVQINFENPALDLPELSISVSQVQLCWTTVANRKYQVQCQPGSAGGQWSNLGDPITATSAKTCVTESVTDTPRFYRIVGLP